MVRFAVTTYLLLATVAGPALCCCALERWSAFFSARSERRSAPRSCCHLTEESASAARQTPTEPPVPARPCPCEQERHRIGLIATVTPAADHYLALAFELIPLAIAPPFAVITSVLRADLSEPFHFLHSQDMLRAFSTWRC